jgi:hypothetical protein
VNDGHGGTEGASRLLDECFYNNDVATSLVTICKPPPRP